MAAPHRQGTVSSSPSASAPPAPRQSRPGSALSWALYDWANSAFAVVVMAGIFPIFYRDYWARGLDDGDVTLSLGVANSLSSLLLILSAPLLGSIADAMGVRKKLLAACAASSAVATAGFAFVMQGAWVGAAVLYVFGVFLFMLGNVFYDALLVDVSEPRRYHRVSSLGYALGYLGGGLALAFCAWMILQAETFGFDDQSGAIRACFALVAVWWLVFSVPLLLRVRERGGVGGGARAGIGRFLETLRLLRRHPQAAWFLLAYWLYIDGVDTVIRMAANYGQVLGFGVSELIAALLLVQFIGFPATIVYGRLAERFGARRLIIAGVLTYLLICVWGAMVQSIAGFYSLVVLIGLTQGGIQAQSRSFYAHLVPAQHSAQLFGVYNLLGKFAALIGPLLLGVVGSVSGSPRLGLLSVSVLFIAGLAVFIARVPRGAGEPHDAGERRDAD